MIGIDVARVKRWYAKTYPQYAGTGYKIEVSSMRQDGIDVDHDLDGVNVAFTVRAYDVNTKAVAHVISGVYNRMHYGGWDANANAGT